MSYDLLLEPDGQRGGTKLLASQNRVPCCGMGYQVTAPIHRKDVIEVRTQHTSLKWMFTYNDPNGRVMRWRLLLREVDFEVLFRPKLVYQACNASRKLLCTLDTQDGGRTCD